jgi:hypothetical protein
VADGEVTWQRFQMRSISGERHPGHVDDGNLQTAQAYLRPGIRRPLDLGAGSICHMIDTNDFNQVNLTPIIAEITSLL